MFKTALVRKPCPNMVEGITEANLGKPDYHKALLQHARYVDVLRQLGLKVEILEPDNRFPDSVFIEDVAVCTPHCAIITRPGAPSRQDEVSTIRDSIYSFYENVEQIKEPGTLDGGDVMMTGSHFYIGLSDRTNKTGANQLINILKRYNLSGTAVPFAEVLHLKTGVSYLEDNNLLVNGKLVKKEEFRNFNKILVPPEEAYAANCVWINGSVIIPAGYPVTQKNIEESGYQTISLEMSEFEKLDGGLSCLSLRF